MFSNRWKKVSFYDLFGEPVRGTRLTSSDRAKGEIPLITAGKINEGLNEQIEPNQKMTLYSNCLTIDMFGNCFYHDYDFYADDNILILKNINFTKNTYLFIKTIIDQSKYKYSYGRQYRQKDYYKDYVYLPYDKGVIDYSYIDKYIDGLIPRISESVNYIIKIAKGDPKTIKKFVNQINIKEFNEWALDKKPVCKKINLKSAEWSLFRIGDYFTTYTGGDLIIGNVKDGEIPVVSHSSANNGVKIYSAPISNRKLFDHTNTISLADRGMFYATIQNEDFYIGTRVKALEAKFQCDINMLFFIATIINNEKYRFNYGRNCTNSLDDLKIYLPSIKKGNVVCPNFQLMSDYINTLQYSKNI